MYQKIIIVLSVSSNGSNGLRRSQDSEDDDGHTAFQYPRTDRMGCDQIVAGGRVMALVPFSILERIEWAATPASPGRPATPTLFQYPRTDRMGCDIAPWTEPATT